ncbi:MAG: aminotransferase class I/II-fold pyridoxal phosphate-dependent enzyme [Candidatus Gracilibacteria bacterium]|jgi:LL-diaminopimelate aminotransferase|nr:aminotransferase class I/II-fold pyridoxal phosphate-dependent enzyme [Candidatus Gracilibacteria bacterium]
MKLSRRISNLGFYAFAEVESKVQVLKDKGIKPVDFGVGDPIEPTPEIIREALKKAADERKTSGYPSYVGDTKYLAKIAEWTKNRFDVELDPKTEITSTVGSKEAVFNFPLAFVDEGDVVISPTPGYPPYQRGTSFAGGTNYLLPLLPENNFMMDIDSIPEEVAQKTVIMWINYPSNPCGAQANPEFFKKVIEFGRKYDVIIASDECYTEIYFNEGNKPHSILEYAEKDDKVVAFHSFSKRSNMTCYRLGWVAGNADVIAAFRKVKTNVDSGTPTFIQDAGIEALNDESHVATQRAIYKRKGEIIRKAFSELGLEDCFPEATFYIWQKIPDQYESSVDFAKELLREDIGVIATPGEWISDEVNGINPGKKYVRFALVPSEEEIELAMEKIKKALS